MIGRRPLELEQQLQTADGPLRPDVERDSDVPLFELSLALERRAHPDLRWTSECQAEAGEEGERRGECRQLRAPEGERRDQAQTGQGCVHPELAGRGACHWGTGCSRVGVGTRSSTSRTMSSERCTASYVRARAWGRGPAVALSLPPRRRGFPRRRPSTWPDAGWRGEGSRTRGYTSAAIDGLDRACLPTMTPSLPVLRSCGAPRVRAPHLQAPALALHVRRQLLAAMRDAGAGFVDPVEIAHVAELEEPELTVLRYEFKADLEAYLASLGPEQPHRMLADLIAFDREHAEVEMPLFEQEHFEAAAELGPLTEPAYLEALATCRRLSRDEGLDAIFDEQRVDAIVAPTPLAVCVPPTIIAAPTISHTRTRAASRMVARRVGFMSTRSTPAARSSSGSCSTPVRSTTWETGSWSLMARQTISPLPHGGMPIQELQSPETYALARQGAALLIYRASPVLKRLRSGNV